MNRYSVTKLSSGVTVVSENLPYVKSFSLGFWFNVGTRDENKRNNGISHFLEHMFFKGTRNRSAKQISMEVEALGGYLNAFTSKEHTCFYGRGLSHNLEKTFAVLSDMLQNSLFDNKEIEKESRVIVDEMKDIEDSPEEIIFDKFESALYKGCSLELPIIGTEKNVLGFKHKDLKNYIEQKYSNDKLFIVASGAINHNDLISIVEKYFNGSFGKNRKRAVRKIAPHTERLFCEKPINQAHVIIGRNTIGYNSDNRMAVSLLSHILGGGSSSRLFLSVREKNGITYQINSFLNSFYDTSTFGVYFSTNEASVQKAIKLIYIEFEKLRRTKVSKKELNRAKEYLKGNLLMSLESTTNRMMQMAQSVIYFGRIKTIEEVIEKIDSVTSDDILKLSNEILNKNDFSTVLVNSKNILN